MSLQLWDDTLSLQRRLEALGLSGAQRVVLHANRTVMVSQAGPGTIRLHRGYTYASDKVLRAIVTFLTPGVPRPLVRRARRELLAFPVEEFVPAAGPAGSPERPRVGDDQILRALRESHRTLNQTHFGDRLAEIPFRLSGRMRSRLGELLLDERRRAREIAISRRHIRRDGWWEVEQTLLHEMVHQWQAEEGLGVDHGASFRAKAREVGAEPKAKRNVQRRKAATY
jgi:hypothetical protein